MGKLYLTAKFILFGIFIWAAFFRFYNLNWDQGYHLHPDERAIIMAVVKLQMPTSISSFFSIDSTWNPHFFAYGSFPFYLLKFFGDLSDAVNPLLGSYDLINIAGRFLSAVFDLITLYLVFRLGRKLFNQTVGFIGALFYGFSVLPIQLSHFYAVDTLLTCFTMATLYQLLLLYEKPSIKRSVWAGVFFGLALATKISAIVLVVSVGAALAADFLLLFVKKPHRPAVWLPHLPKFVIHLLKYAVIVALVTAITFLICEPYAVIDFKEFWQQTLQQSEMTHNAFIFPYTLQYVGIIPYWYELKNIFLWGLGPVLATLSFAGALYFTILAFFRDKQTRWAREVILITFFWVYFWVVGRFAVGFMRYMLPLYPLLALFSAVLVQKIFSYFQIHRYLKLVLFAYLGVFIILWPISFVRIYSKPNPRTAATDWVISHIPAGKTLAIEHWDDPIPLRNASAYQILTLPMYDPDTTVKWQGILRQLQQTDYIIIASNRLSAPLQRLTDCRILPAERCYPLSATYYRRLMSGQMGFEKVAEFTDYPLVPFFDTPIHDQGADESFTVYDHPKIMIFKKVTNNANI